MSERFHCIKFLFVLQEIKAVGSDLGITPVIIRGEELKQRGFGGIASAASALFSAY